MTQVLNHSRIGQGPELIILHGLFGSSSNWRTIANALSAQYTVSALDARNHGNSYWSDSMAYTEMADDVARFMDHYGIEKTNLLGHSMGGKTAMTFALHHPQRVNRLVVADMAVRAYTDNHSHEQNIKAMQNIDLTNLSAGRKQVEQHLFELLDEPKPVIQFLLQNLVIKDNKPRWRINLPVIKRSLESIMGSIEETVQPGFEHQSLFLFGENSQYVRPEDHPAILNLFPNAVFTGIKNAGHWLHAEQPVEFTAKLKEFLA